MTKHIKILGKGNSSILLDKTAIESFLKGVVEKVGMVALSDPIIYDIPLSSDGDGLMEEGGIAGVIVLTTSHCAIHTWPLKKEFYFDIYSCREFNKDLTIKYVNDFFQCYDLKVSDLTSITGW